MDFEHFIFTRFNLGLYRRHPSPDAWMTKRLDLFERYTLPSMMRQTTNRWTWLLAFDPQTPECITARYDYLDRVQVIYEPCQDWMRANVDMGGWLITSRLDNDDYVERDWVERIQAEFNRSELVVDFHGRALNLETGKYFNSDRTLPNSMFLSLIEHGSTCKTCHAFNHTDMVAHYPSKLIEGFGWTMIIHDDNLMNTIRPTFLPSEIQTLYANG